MQQLFIFNEFIELKTYFWLDFVSLDDPLIVPHWAFHLKIIFLTLEVVYFFPLHSRTDLFLFIYSFINWELGWIFIIFKSHL